MSETETIGTPVKLAWRIIVAAILALLSLSVTGAAENPFHRPLFTNQALRGSPEPPLPFRAQRAFPKLSFKNPLFITHHPGDGRMLVVEQAGRILAFTNDADAAATDLFWSLADHDAYALTFHPGFATNRFVFIFANGPNSASTRTNKIFRYQLSNDFRRCDNASQRLIIDWESNGHNGGDLAFGPDGMLYISSGDGTSDSDKNLTGQDITDLTGGILRIDVNRANGDRLYAIPSDNPFLHVPAARGELWCYGLRNPWRIHFDQAGRLWIGDIGQDTWEMILIGQRGANYGWSVVEAGHPFQLQRQRGPTPFTTPLIALPHSEARSITGGIVYLGRKLPRLRGAYVFGDYATGRIWAARLKDEQLASLELIADTPHQLLGFGEDSGRELFYADYAGGIYELVSAPPATHTHTFPRRLSETGLFASTREHRPAPGVVPYEVNAPYWSDGAFAERFIALPGHAQIRFSRANAWEFPEGTVLVQSLGLELERDRPGSRRWIETRILLLQDKEWAGYSYRWNDQQTDAELLPSSGDDREFTIREGRKIREQTWLYPSRTDCLTCHSRAAHFILGLNTAQLNRTMEIAGATTNQIGALFARGVLKPLTNELNFSNLPKLANPYASEANRAERVHAYLRINCSHCHTDAGGGNSAMEMRAAKLEEMRLIGVLPQHDTFELPQARIIAPGHPERSVLLHRISQRGYGRMPPLSITTVDEQAVELFKEWIRELQDPVK